MLYVNCNHECEKWRAVRLCDLHVEKLLIWETNSQTRSLFERVCTEAGIWPLRPIEINNWDAFREAAARSLCIAVVGDLGLVPDQRLYQLQINDTYIRMNRRLDCPKERCNARLIKPFIEVR